MARFQDVGLIERTMNGDDKAIHQRFIALMIARRDRDISLRFSIMMARCRLVVIMRGEKFLKFADFWQVVAGACQQELQCQARGVDSGDNDYR